MLYIYPSKSVLIVRSLFVFYIQSTDEEFMEFWDDSIRTLFKKHYEICISHFDAEFAEFAETGSNSICNCGNVLRLQTDKPTVLASCPKCSSEIHTHTQMSQVAYWFYRR